jgi:hypothetical protein
MDQDPAAQYMPYVSGATSIKAYRMSDGEVVAEVPLEHSVVSGTSRDDMIASIGSGPSSMIVIRNRHVPEQQQLVELSGYPSAVAISPDKHTIAVALSSGLFESCQAGVGRISI